MVKMFLELKDTADLMNSTNYKNRFLAEYYQTKIIYENLHKIIIKHEAGTLDFDLECPVDLLKEYARAMGHYLYMLEVRAEIENIEL